MKNNFKIVKILDEYTVVINAGSNHGIEFYDNFQILDKSDNAVIDPDTKDILGYLDLIKATVVVSEVQAKMCVCTTPIMSVLSPAEIISSSLKTRKEKLNIDLDQVTGGLRQSNEPIRIGDTVRLIKTSKKTETEM